MLNSNTQSCSSFCVGESKWLRLRGLLIPSQPSDILLLGLALLGHFLASAAAMRISKLLGFLTSVPPSLQLVQPELATVSCGHSCNLILTCSTQRALQLELGAFLSLTTRVMEHTRPG